MHVPTYLILLKEANYNYMDYLGLEDSLVVSKHRISYFYKDKYEISFDEVDKLGLYVEIEVKKYENNNEKEIEDLIVLMKELNINMDNIETKRYPELLEEKLD